MKNKNGKNKNEEDKYSIIHSYELLKSLRVKIVKSKRITKD